MHICLFGGAFDPPHLGHQQVARSVIEQKICDEVWFVPVKQHPFGKKVEANGHRASMLEMILEPKMRVERYELDHPVKSYSFNTLEALSKQYPEHTFSWVIGTDNLAKFDLWGNFQELLNRYKVYVYPRKNFPFESLKKGMIKLDKMPEVAVSSTQVREKLQKTASITGLVDPRVEQYIKEKGLYDTLS